MNYSTLEREVNASLYGHVHEAHNKCKKTSVLRAGIKMEVLIPGVVLVYVGALRTLRYFVKDS